MEKKPTEYDDFNWVEARQNCSVVAQFKLLQETVESNVTERKTQLGEKAQVKLAFESNSESEFRVIRQSQSGFKIIVFRRRKDHIFIEEDEAGGETIRLELVQNDDSECRLKVDDGETTFLRWQVAQKALEDILF